ncbi:hypothetical protein PN925_001205 [Morganella morganii]|uniref:Uncharacterized protein n=1 Tax=Morganella morganii TaxID=582 RepID=A0AAI9HQ43_MORMO|nr:hypothetical protein [Providencia rettgeri]EKH6495283.1 hypothetical protein [Providencia rettgeri]EKW8760480.1 hypothetical protein [Morganella morganii]
MNENLPSSLTFTLNRQPVFYIRENEILTPSIQVSPIKDKEFCVPLYADSGFDNGLIQALQSQGADKLANSIQNILRQLKACDYYSVEVVQAMEAEISCLRAFAEQLRNPVIKSNLCDSCNDWPRGGCSSTCSVYGKESHHE